MTVIHDNEGNPVAMGGALRTTNELQKFRDGFDKVNTDLWDVITGAGDIVEAGGNTAGSGYVKISKSLDQEGTETVFLSKFYVTSPVRLALGMSLSQRLMHQLFSVEIVGVDVDGNVINTLPIPPSLDIASITQATTTLTITTTTNHGLVPGDRIVVSGVVDSRFNYGYLLVNTITSPTGFTCIATPSGALPSVTATPTASGQVFKMDALLRADNAIGMFWEGTAASNVKMISRTAGGALYNSVDTSLGSNHTNATQANTNNFADAWNPSYVYDLRYKVDGFIARTLPLDSTNGIGGILKRTQVIPEIKFGYKVRIRARNSSVMTKPVAKIINAVKSATTTATITTDVPHGLTITDYVQIYGNRDQTNFANLTTPTAVLSVIDANNFTIAYGASFTGNTRGGSVIKVQGSYTVAPSAQSVQSVQSTGGQLTVVGSGTWSGFSVGDTVELHGLADSTDGTQYTQYEGAYKVLSMSTTTLILSAPLITDFALLNVGGTVFKRTDLRLHLLRVLEYTRNLTELDGSSGNYTDLQDSIGVNVINTPGVTVSSGTITTLANGQTAHDSVITGSPLRIGGRALTTPYTAVASGDAADLITTTAGALIIKPYSFPEYDWQVAPAAVVTTTDVVLKALNATYRNYVTGFQFINTGTVATEIVIKDGATVIWRGFAPASMLDTITIVLSTPLRGSVNTALNFACITTAANVYISAQGYQAI